MTVSDRGRSSNILANETIRASISQIFRGGANRLGLRDVSLVAGSTHGDSSSTRTESPLSVLVDGHTQTSGAMSTGAHFTSGDHCFFVDGAWNCTGDRCSNPKLHVS
jgi:hypothetical protein